MSDSPKKIRENALTTLISAAFFSWQSALIIAISIIMYAFNVSPFGISSLFWVAFGIIGVLLFVGVTVTDPAAQRQIMDRLLTEKYTPSDIKNPMARNRLEKALEYYSEIQTMAANRTGASRMEFELTLQEIDNWIGQLYSLGKKVDQFDENQLINRDRMQVDTELDGLKRRLNVEQDPKVKEAIQNSIRLKETQLANLKSLESNIKRADIQMDNTVTALATVYAQMQNIGSKDIDKSSAQRLRNEIHDQVLSLEDTISAIDDVQSSARTY